MWNIKFRFEEQQSDGSWKEFNGWDNLCIDGDFDDGRPKDEEIASVLDDVMKRFNSDLRGSKPRRWSKIGEVKWEEPEPEYEDEWEEDWDDMDDDSWED